MFIYSIYKTNDKADVKAKLKREYVWTMCI